MLSTPLVREYLVNYARPLIFSTALAFPALAAIRASLRLLRGGDTIPVRSARPPTCPSGQALSGRVCVG